LLLDYTCAEVI